jgi:hypothetical protein
MNLIETQSRSSLLINIAVHWNCLTQQSMLSHGCFAYDVLQQLHIALSEVTENMQVWDVL